MKFSLRILLSILVVSSSAISFAGTGMLFNVTKSNNHISIQSTPNHAYPAAGIKINTPGYTLSGQGTECTMLNNGFCSFPVSNTNPATISVSGNTTLSITLCLNAKGQQSCQMNTFAASDNIPTLPTTARYAYVTNYTGSPAISLCALDSSGEISSCQDAGGDSVLSGIGPQGITLNTASTYAYITTSSGFSNIYQCSINASNGTFNTCSETTITSPSGYATEYGMVALNTANTIAYVGDNSSGGRVLACPIVNGIISATCTNTGANNFSSSLSGITLNKAGTLAYISDYSNSTVTVCSVNNTTFSSCVAKTGGGSITFSEPGSTALNQAETTIYVADYGNNVVYACDATPGGGAQFANCTSVATVSHAWGITINRKYTMAYIADYNSTVTQCPILSNGTFGTCVPRTTFSGPVDVALGY